MTYTIEAITRDEIVRQVGRMNILAISGGRVGYLPDGIELPVGNGYRVRVRLTPADDYTVERVFVRSAVEYSKGIEDMVYCDEVGETAYRASCFRNNDADYWPAALDNSTQN